MPAGRQTGKQEAGKGDPGVRSIDASNAQIADFVGVTDSRQRDWCGRLKRVCWQRLGILSPGRFKFKKKCCNSRVEARRQT